MRPWSTRLTLSVFKGKFYIRWRAILPAFNLIEPGRSDHFSRSIIKVAVISVFTALSLSTNYLMIDAPNIKLMDSLIFIAGFLFGLDVGVATAVFVWLVYVFVNPSFHAALFFPFFFFP